MLNYTHKFKRQVIWHWKIAIWWSYTVLSRKAFSISTPFSLNLLSMYLPVSHQFITKAQLLPR